MHAEEMPRYQAGSGEGRLLPVPDIGEKLGSCVLAANAKPTQELL